MCTLDPLGYASTQYFTVPFLVLKKAIENNLQNKTESNTQLLEMIQETCNYVIIQNNTLKQTIIDQTRAFVDHAQNRTADVIPSLAILAAQLHSWNNLSDKQKKIKIQEDPQNE